MSRAFPPIEALVPHRGPMRMVDAVVSDDGQRAVVESRVDPSWALADPLTGALPGFAALEVMAQAIAAVARLRDGQRDGPPRVGFLLGTRRYRCAVDAFEPGSVLHVEVTGATRSTQGLAVFDCAIRLAGATVAEASVNVFQPDDVDAFMAREGASPRHR